MKPRHWMATNSHGPSMETQIFSSHSSTATAATTRTRSTDSVAPQVTVLRVLQWQRTRSSVPPDTPSTLAPLSKWLQSR